MLMIYRVFRWLALGGFAALLSWAPQAAEWTAPLKGGGEVTVDPQTNRATLLKNGVQTQLWDGVHQLEDGSTLTIHSGQAIPNEEILRSREMPSEPEPTEADQWVGAPIVGYSPCERLERRVCGVSQECSSAEPCHLARQLLEMESRERNKNDSPNYMTPASGQCQEASQDMAFFVTCGRQPGSGSAANSSARAGLEKAPSACQLLVDKVCGYQGACSDQMACDAAQQLLRMAKEPVVDQVVSSKSSPSEYQCAQALTDESFFKRCKQ
jgi:hypothetical protein